MYYENKQITIAVNVQCVSMQVLIDNAKLEKDQHITLNVLYRTDSESNILGECEET